jgi:hypothetical protein
LMLPLTLPKAASRFTSRVTQADQSWRVRGRRQGIEPRHHGASRADWFDAIGLGRMSDRLTSNVRITHKSTRDDFGGFSDGHG